MVTVHQSIGEAKEQFYYERTVFLRCVANSNPPVRYSWHRGREVLTQGSDKGVEIYEPFFTQVSQRQRGPGREKKNNNKIFLKNPKEVADRTRMAVTGQWFGAFGKVAVSTFC